MCLPDLGGEKYGVITEPNAMEALGFTGSAYSPIHGLLALVVMEIAGNRTRVLPGSGRLSWPPM
jgi:hypothetical protein